MTPRCPLQLQGTQYMCVNVGVPVAGKKKKPEDISNTWSHYSLWLHGNHKTLKLVVENVVIL